MGKGFKLRRMRKAQIEAVLKDSGTVDEASTRLGVHRSTLFRWFASGRFARPGEAAPELSNTANSPHLPTSHDDLRDFPLEQLLNGPRPGHADPDGDKRWLRARHYILRIADTRFDPRQILGMSGGEYAVWCQRRLEWLREVTNLWR